KGPGVIRLLFAQPNTSPELSAIDRPTCPTCADLWLNQHTLTYRQQSTRRRPAPTAEHIPRMGHAKRRGGSDSPLQRLHRLDPCEKPELKDGPIAGQTW